MYYSGGHVTCSVGLLVLGHGFDICGRWELASGLSDSQTFSILLREAAKLCKTEMAAANRVLALHRTTENEDARHKRYTL